MLVEKEDIDEKEEQELTKSVAYTDPNGREYTSEELFGGKKGRGRPPKKSVCERRLLEPDNPDYLEMDQYTDKSGYIKVRKEPGHWVYLHVLVWEKENGPRPEGSRIKFVNGDKKDVRLENLMLIYPKVHRTSTEDLKRRNEELEAKVSELEEEIRMLKEAILGE